MFAVPYLGAVWGKKRLSFPLGGVDNDKEEEEQEKQDYRSKSRSRKMSRKAGGREREL